MKVDEIIQRVQSLYSKGVQSDDTRLMSRHIYNKLLTVRSKLISQEAKKKQKISPWNYQTIPCIELIKVPAHDCPCIPPIGCEILRSKYPLPQPLSGLSGILIQSVTTIDRSIKIDEVSLNAASYQKGNKYTPKKLNYFIFKDYIYITTPSKLKAISLTGLFEDPLDVKLFKGYCDDCVECVECLDFKEEDFPINNDMIDTVIELTIQELVILFGQNVEDLTNNGTDGVKQQSK
jgi:hypothetical protein